MAKYFSESKISERTKLMMSEFINLRNSGMSIHEIAEKFGLSDRSIYLHLQEIANENNVSREELLFRIHKKHNMSEGERHQKEIVSPEELEKNFLEILNSVDCIISIIDMTMADNMEEK